MSGGADLSPLARVAAAHAMRPQPAALFTALEGAVADAIGYRLFTVLLHDAEGGVMRRLHSTRPDIDPVGGSKPVTDSQWMKQVLVRGEPYIGRTPDDLRTVFFDHEVLISIGCGSVLNMPVVWSGTVLGSLNILHREGWYDESHLPVARLLAQLTAPALMPGLIDCHVHVVASMMNLSANARLPDATAVLRSLPIMRGMLHRGFTTVRDVGGAPFALAEAVADGLAEGPRLIVCGKALSKTGGHTDFRPRADTHDPYRWTSRFGALGRIADGVDEIRRAARQEFRQGARFLKIMANGGVGSPTDPVAWIGYTAEEMTAAVEEAADAQTYVSAHLYTAAAIKRALRCGVHSLEHCNIIDAEAAAMAAAAGAVAVPTLVTYEALAEDGGRLGLPPESIAKIADVRTSGLASLQLLSEAGVAMAYGTDLLGESHERQSEEFAIRARVLPSRSILAAATTVAAELVGMADRIGVVREGAMADVLVVDGDPLEDVAVLSRPASTVKLVMKGGRIVRNDLAT